MRERPVPDDGIHTDGRITPACAGTTKDYSPSGPVPKDHPRLCGNDTSSERVGVTSTGSPPLVRERLSSWRHISATSRITPACAGTTMTTGALNIDGEDHPRLCGNDGVLNVLHVRAKGSPPLVRERLTYSPFTNSLVGITPACAGTTFDFVGGVFKERDHPRLCGNDISSIALETGFAGSPPLVRERPGDTRQMRNIARITPACAGTTGPSFALRNAYQDHPRLCGNDCGKRLKQLRVTGSPPLVRERPCDFGTDSPRFGITPACAGTTPLFEKLYESMRDHPRLCGNDSGMASTLLLAVGSPPLVRERLCFFALWPDHSGITPACAGTTRPSVFCQVQPWDHPRLCGNDLAIDGGDCVGVGSPPLVRERLGSATGEIVGGGITPACAGTTVIDPL